MVGPSVPNSTTQPAPHGPGFVGVADPSVQHRITPFFRSGMDGCGPDPSSALLRFSTTESPCRMPWDSSVLSLWMVLPPWVIHWLSVGYASWSSISRLRVVPLAPRGRFMSRVGPYGVRTSTWNAICFLAGLVVVGLDTFWSSGFSVAFALVGLGLLLRAWLVWDSAWHWERLEGTLWWCSGGWVGFGPSVCWDSGLVLGLQVGSLGSGVGGSLSRISHRSSLSAWSRLWRRMMRRLFIWCGRGCRRSLTFNFRSLLSLFRRFCSIAVPAVLRRSRPIRGIRLCRGLCVIRLRRIYLPSGVRVLALRVLLDCWEDFLWLLFGSAAAIEIMRK